MGKKSGKQKKKGGVAFLVLLIEIVSSFLLVSDVLDFLTNVTPSSAITLTVIVSWERKRVDPKR